jgi:hypothetical protein
LADSQDSGRRVTGTAITGASFTSNHKENPEVEPRDFFLILLYDFVGLAVFDGFFGGHEVVAVRSAQ